MAQKKYWLSLVTVAVAVVASLLLYACNRSSGPDPQLIQARYGLTDASLENIANSSEGSFQATVVPITLADGSRAQLVIPRKQTDYPVYLRDQSGGLIPVSLQDRNVKREEFVRSRPVMVEHRTAPTTTTVQRRKKRSFEKELLIVGGSAAAGGAIGAIAGGGKGAGIGALSGGVAGLVYDLATRHR